MFSTDVGSWIARRLPPFDLAALRRALARRAPSLAVGRTVVLDGLEPGRRICWIGCRVVYTGREPWAGLAETRAALIWGCAVQVVYLDRNPVTEARATHFLRWFERENAS